MANIHQVADYFLAAADPEDDITNMKLQKLCAYAQAYALALLDRPLFPEIIQAWKHGPVIPEAYGQYKSQGRNALSTDIELAEARTAFTSEELYILETVNGYYGRYTASALRNMSHSDFPGDFHGFDKAEITPDAIKAAFAQNNVVKTIKAELA